MEISSENSKMKLIDIRGSSLHSVTNDNLKKIVHDGLLNKTFPFKDTFLRTIPTLILYDDKGLDIFDKITYCADYYLTNSEIDILKNYSHDFVQKYIQNGSAVIELGCGYNTILVYLKRLYSSMRKTRLLLEAIVNANKTVSYYAIDLSEKSLADSLKPLSEAFPRIDVNGLLGTYEDSLLWIHDHIPIKTPKVFLWLGSSIGNYNREEAGEFLYSLQKSAMSTKDILWCGIDRRNEPSKIALAYNDSQGITRDFIMNGLKHVNVICEAPIFDQNAFEYISIYNEKAGRHEAYYKSLKDQTLFEEDPLQTIHLKQDEMIWVEYSYKYSPDEVSQLLNKAKMEIIETFTDKDGLYDLHLLKVE